MDLIDIFRTFHPNAEEYTFFSSAHGTFSRIDHILGHKSNLSKFKKIEIVSSIFYDHNATEPSSLLPPHSIPLGRPSAPAPSIQYRASNLDWQLISYMIFYMFQCHSPKSSHPLPLSQSP